MLYIVRVIDKCSRKFDDFPCEESDIEECAEWLSNKLAYELVMRESVEESASTAAGLPYRTIMNRVNERKKEFKIAIFDAPEDDQTVGKNDYSKEQLSLEEEISIEL